MRFDTKDEGGPLGEGGERYYNFVRLVRGGVDDATEGSDDEGTDIDDSGSEDSGSGLPGFGGPGTSGSGTNEWGLLENSCDGLMAGDACSLIGPLGVETGICRTGFAGLRCVP